MVISWGSTYPAVRGGAGGEPPCDFSHLHFSQVYPLPPGLDRLLNKARKRIVIEGNASGQFADAAGT